MRPRSLLPVAAVLVLAGCTAPPGPPPLGPQDTVVQLGLFGASGSASWTFDPDHPVLLLSASHYATNETTKELRYPSSPLRPAASVLRLEGFGPNAWASLPSTSALLVLTAEERNATFTVLLSERSLTVEQLDAAGLCGGNATLSTGTVTALGPGPWTSRVPPGVSAIYTLAGPAPCEGTVLRTSHLGAWTARPASGS